MHVTFTPIYERTKEIAAILVTAGLKTEAFDPGTAEYPNLGVFVVDPREPKALWEFSPSDNEGDAHGWNYQIGTAVGEEYEGIVFETLNESLAHDAPSEAVAREIQKVIEMGIDPEDLIQILSAYDHMWNT